LLDGLLNQKVISRKIGLFIKFIFYYFLLLIFNIGEKR
ncbi:unnamed protein product, partial [marine sediment metagenome]